MHLTFYVAGAIAIITTVMVITRRNAIHALLYFILSLIAVAVIFLDVGAPFVAVLEVIIYAGAIMVLFIFVIMLLSPAASTLAQPSLWVGPAILSVLLTAGVISGLVGGQMGSFEVPQTTPKEIGEALFGPYLLGVELSSLLLLAGLVAALHLGRREKPKTITDKPVGGRLGEPTPEKEKVS